MLYHFSPGQPFPELLLCWATSSLSLSPIWTTLLLLWAALSLSYLVKSRLFSKLLLLPHTYSPTLLEATSSSSRFFFALLLLCRPNLLQTSSSLGYFSCAAALLVVSFCEPNFAWNNSSLSGLACMVQAAPFLTVFFCRSPCLWPAPSLSYFFSGGFFSEALLFSEPSLLWPASSLSRSVCEPRLFSELFGYFKKYFFAGPPHLWATSSLHCPVMGSTLVSTTSALIQLWATECGTALVLATLRHLPCEPVPRGRAVALHLTSSSCTPA